MSKIIQLYSDKNKTIKAYPKTLASQVYMDDGQTTITSQLDNNVQEINKVKTDYAKKTEVSDLAINKMDKSKLNDMQETTDNLWSAKKIKDTITTIPKGDKGDKGDSGTASLAINDTVTTTGSAWSGEKIGLETIKFIPSTVCPNYTYQTKEFDFNSIAGNEACVIFGGNKYQIPAGTKVVNNVGGMASKLVFNYDTKAFEFKDYTYINGNKEGTLLTMRRSGSVSEISFSADFNITINGYDAPKLANNFINKNNIADVKPIFKPCFLMCNSNNYPIFNSKKATMSLPQGGMDYVVFVGEKAYTGIQTVEVNLNIGTSAVAVLFNTIDKTFIAVAYNLVANYIETHALFCVIRRGVPMQVSISTAYILDGQVLGIGSKFDKLYAIDYENDLTLPTGKYSISNNILTLNGNTDANCVSTLNLQLPKNNYIEIELDAKVDTGVVAKINCYGGCGDNLILDESNYFKHYKLRFLASKIGGSVGCEIGRFNNSLGNVQIANLKVRIVEGSNEQSNVKFIAHRGCSTNAPENTMSAYKLAKKLGFKYVETDLQLTSDKKWVLIHDYTVDRTSNGSGNVKDMTLEQIRQLDFGSKFSSDFTNEPIPALEEFIKWCSLNNIHPYLEIKSTNADDFNEYYKIVDVLKKYNMIRNCSFIGDMPELTKVSELTNKKCRYGWLRACTTEGIPQLKTLGENVFFNGDDTNTTIERINIARQNDVEVECWTINTIQKATYFINAGVTGISTDRINLSSCNF